MNIIELSLVSVITFIYGVICTLAVQFYLFKKYLDGGPVANDPETTPHGKAVLPEELLNNVKNVQGGGNENLAINLTLQFLFNELRNAERVRLWLYRKLNNEFKEMVAQTTTGKLFDSVEVNSIIKRLCCLSNFNCSWLFPTQLRDLNLGNQFPVIKGLEVADSKIDSHTGLLESLDLALDLHYSGNFQLSIDVKMLLGKTAYMALQVKRISGRARLQFTRVPYTHWSLSFYTEPILELDVQSQFQGRQLQPQIISLITGQIRRAVRRKHTLPRYKMRYKPFFRRLNDEAIDLSEVIGTRFGAGCLEVTLIEVTRLNHGIEDPSQLEIYCTMSMDTTPWIYLTRYNNVPYMVLDLIISKTSSQQLGVVFKQDIVPEMGQQQTNVTVETIVAGSPASIAEMKKGDILIAVDGKKITNMNQVAKLVKAAVQRRFIIRVERKYDKKLDTVMLKETMDIVDNLDKVKFSDLKDYDYDEIKTTSRLFKRRKSSMAHLNTDDTVDGVPSRKISMTVEDHGINDLYFTSKEKTYASLMNFYETRHFQIDSEFVYLNIGVWSRSRNNDKSSKLLGYINSPIKLIIAQCSTSSTGRYLKCHALLPPDSACTAMSGSKLHGYSGFDQILCYGDILLSYSWESSYTNTVKKENSETANKNNNRPQVCHEEVKKQHDFIRTHFHRATHCDFCTKKIWLKDAVQCRDCGTVCHKKCESRCQSSATCGNEQPSTNMALEAEEIDETGPEINLTGCEESTTVQGASMMAVRASIANTLMGLKKAGSTSCLAPPSSGIGLASRSLPPSPCASRKNSLLGGLGLNPELLEGAEPSVSGPLIAGDLDDGLMSKAKDTGKYLHRNLEPEQRVDKINFMMGKLRTALDAEITSRDDLAQQNLNNENNKLIAQSDSRVQALSVLLLHYCAGLQHAQEAYDQTNQTN